MRYSQLFGKTKRQPPTDAETISHKLLVQAGFVDQTAAGVFSILPLGRRVLDRIDQIIREEINKIGGQELTLPALHPKGLWLKSGRWESFDVLFKIKAREGREYALGPTHEEVLTPLVAEFVQSYKDLPLFLYQIQTKFRDELRAKSGLIRGREFGMKDLYSFHTGQADLESYYEKAKQAYFAIFNRCGLQAKLTEASGGTFTSKFSHEFNVISEAGEVDLLYCKNCPFAQNIEVSNLKVGDKCPSCQAKLRMEKAIEVGNIFDLGTKFSEVFGLYFTDRDGKRKPVVMGCYGIGDTRLMATIVEVGHDEKGIIWPPSVAPYEVHLLDLVRAKTKNYRAKTNLKSPAEEIYQALIKQEVEVLYDDRDEASAGEKFADADLIGCPYRLVVSAESLKKGGVEVKKRYGKTAQIVPVAELYSGLQPSLQKI